MTVREFELADGSRVELQGQGHPLAADELLARAVRVGVTLQGLALYQPFLARVLDTVKLTVQDWWVIGSTIILPVIVVEITKWGLRGSHSHKKNLKFEIWFGSNADRVLRQAPCPVLIARPLKPAAIEPSTATNGNKV